MRENCAFFLLSFSWNKINMCLRPLHDKSTNRVRAEGPVKLGGLENLDYHLIISFACFNFTPPETHKTHRHNNTPQPAVRPVQERTAVSTKFKVKLSYRENFKFKIKCQLCASQTQFFCVSTVVLQIWALWERVSIPDVLSPCSPANTNINSRLRHSFFFFFFFASLRICAIGVCVFIQRRLGCAVPVDAKANKDKVTLGVPLHRKDALITGCATWEFQPIQSLRPVILLGWRCQIFQIRCQMWAWGYFQ